MNNYSQVIKFKECKTNNGICKEKIFITPTDKTIKVHLVFYLKSSMLRKEVSKKISKLTPE